MLWPLRRHRSRLADVRASYHRVPLGVKPRHAAPRVRRITRPAEVRQNLATEYGSVARWRGRSWGSIFLPMRGGARRLLARSALPRTPSAALARKPLTPAGSKLAPAMAK